MHPDFDDFDDESTFTWDEEAKSVSLNIRLKAATAMIAVGLMMATPASAQVVIGRASTGSDLQVVAPPRSALPPEWLRHIPKADGKSKPYQPKRGMQAAPSVAPKAPSVAPNYTTPAPLPIAPSNIPVMRAPQVGSAPAAPTFSNAPQDMRPTQKDSQLMAAPWSPRAQHIDKPLFPELQPRVAAPAARASNGGAVLAAPQLGGSKAAGARDASNLPPVLTNDLMGSLRQAAQDEDAGLPPPVPHDEGNGVNASSAQDRTQTLGTIERSRIDAVVDEREARESGRPYTPRAPAPRDRDDVPLPPSPAPTPAPSTMGYLTPPRGAREDEVTVPAKPYASDSLAPLDKADEVTVRVEDDAPAAEQPRDTSGRRVLGRASDRQKPTVYNDPVPVPTENVLVPPKSDGTIAPVPMEDAPQDDKAFKAEGRKLFSAAKKKKDKAASAEQLSLFEQSQQNNGARIVKVPQDEATEEAPKNILSIKRDDSSMKPLESEGKAAVDTATSTLADGTKEIKEVPVNRTPFGDNVISTITAGKVEDEAAAPTASSAGGVPDITQTQSAPKVLGKGPRKTVRKLAPAPVPAPAPVEDIVEAPAKPAPESIAEPAPEPVVQKKAAPVAAPADDEIRITVDDEPVDEAPAVISPRVEAAPKNVLRAPMAPRVEPRIEPRAEPRIEAPAKPAPEPYVPPRAALRQEYRTPVEEQPAQTLRAPTSLAPMDDAPAARQAAPRAAPAYNGPRAPQEQMYVQTPAAQDGSRKRLRTPKLLLEGDLPAAAPVTVPPAAPVAEITADTGQEVVVEPTVIERPALTAPAEPEIAPVYIAPQPAEIELRMPTVTFGPTERDLDQEGETQVDILAEQMSLNPGRKLTLIAYAQAPNLNDSRRVALSRALAIRSRLAEYGIQPIRVAIRAVGALQPGDRGTPDRVDTIIQ